MTVADWLSVAELPFWLGALVCYIVVLIRLIQTGRTRIGFACLALSLLCGLGGLVVE